MSEFDEAEFTNSVVGNAFKLWFAPELERRVAAGELPTGVKIWAAQIIMDLEHAHIINFNDQIEGVLAARKEPDVSIVAGQVVTIQDIGAIEGLTLTNEHANAAHLTVIWHKGSGYLLFDFRYNAERINKLVQIADEFLDSADHALANDLIHPFAESLFAGVELMAKALLMAQPDLRFLGRHSHGLVETELHRYARFGNVPQPYVDLYKRLVEVRPGARFGRSTLVIAGGEMTEMLGTARAMRNHVEEVSPSRYQLSDEPPAA